MSGADASGPPAGARLPTSDQTEPARRQAEPAQRQAEPELLLLRADRARARSAAAAREAEYTSRSYREPWALIAWHQRRVGVDAERIGPRDGGDAPGRSRGNDSRSDDLPDFARSICTPDELHRFARELDDPEFVASLWSSKEALSKALGDALDYDPRRLPSPLGWPGADVEAVPVLRARPGDRREAGPGLPPRSDDRRRAGRWQARRLTPPDVPEGHVGWVVWR